jgi:hypothetical protein
MLYIHFYSFEKTCALFWHYLYELCWHIQHFVLKLFMSNWQELNRHFLTIFTKKLLVKLDKNHQNMANNFQSITNNNTQHTFQVTDKLVEDSATSWIPRGLPVGSPGSVLATTATLYGL